MTQPSTRDHTEEPADTAGPVGAEPAASRLDVDFVRTQFPAFDEPSLQGWIHAQNAGGSYACRQVIDLLTTFYTTTKLQGGDHFPAAAAGLDAMARARPGLARWLNVGEDEIHIGPSTAANTTTLAAAFGEVVGDGDAVVVTNLDHEANSGAWRDLAHRGVEVREWQVDPATARLHMDDLDALLDETVAIVAFPQVSNIAGEPTPVADIAARAHAVGAVAIVDGVAAAPHGMPDVDALGVDVYLFSTYKTFGPHQGVMVVRRDLAARLSNQGPFFYDEVVQKWFNPAGPDHAQVAAVAGVTDYLDLVAAHHLGPDVPMPARRAGLNQLIAAHEQELMTPIMEVVADRDGVRLVGTTDPNLRMPTLSLITEQDPSTLAAALAERRIMADASHFHAWRLVEALGVDPLRGVLRVSLVHSSSKDEAALIAAALDAVL